MGSTRRTSLSLCSTVPERLFGFSGHVTLRALVPCDRRSVAYARGSVRRCLFFNSGSDAFAITQPMHAFLGRLVQSKPCPLEGRGASLREIASAMLWFSSAIFGSATWCRVQRN